MRSFRVTAAGSLMLAAGMTGCAAPKVGKTAPNFTLQDLSGQSVSLSQFNGKPVLLSFFAVK